MFHPDFVDRLPRSPVSGPRVRCVLASKCDNYPGGLPPDSWMPPTHDMIGEDERWADIPGVTRVVPLAQPDRVHDRDTVIATQTARLWQPCCVVELRDGKIAQIGRLSSRRSMPAPLAESIAHFPHG